MDFERFSQKVYQFKERRGMKKRKYYILCESKRINLTENEISFRKFLSPPRMFPLFISIISRRFFYLKKIVFLLFDFEVKIQLRYGLYLFLRI